MTEVVEVAVVGAGLSGLLAARRLAAAGRDVVVLDKAAKPGGRLATRRIGAATLDHGAQFFTVREPAFAHLVDEWRRSGLGLRSWANGFAQATTVEFGPEAADPGDDGHHRYIVDGGMNVLAKRLSAGLALRGEARVRAVRPDADRWRIEIDARDSLSAEAVVLTAPAPQALRLLEEGVAVPTPVRDLAYWPCLCLLAVLDRPLALPRPGGVQLSRGPVSWLGDNVAKGVSGAPALTAHGAGQWSRDRWDADDGALLDELLELVRPWLGESRVLEAQLKRWRYSAPTDVHPDRAVLIESPAPLVLAGDAYGGAKVEGAALSGLAAAEELLG